MNDVNWYEIKLVKIPTNVNRVGNTLAVATAVVNCFRPVSYTHLLFLVLYLLFHNYALIHLLILLLLLLMFLILLLFDLELIDVYKRQFLLQRLLISPNSNFSLAFKSSSYLTVAGMIE